MGIAVSLIAIGILLLALQWFRFSLEYLVTKLSPGYGDLETAQDFHWMPIDFFEIGIVLICGGLGLLAWELI